MEPRNSIVKNIETYVNCSTSIAQQNASAKALASLLKNDTITMEYLVREMELYLTTTDDILRARGLLLLAEVLGLLQLKHLKDVTIHTLVGFFTERLLCFELLDCLLDRYPESFSDLGDHLVYGVCEAIEGEKDPQCLVHVFHIVEGVSRIYPDPAGPVASIAEELFDNIGCYFPIHYTHPKNEDVDVSRDDLSRALMMAFSASPFFEPFAIPLLLEKLASTLPLAKIDSLKYLSHCTEKYGPVRVEKYLVDIWSSVKTAICDFTSENNSLVFDLPPGQGYQESEITREAMNLVQKLVSIQNYSFLNLVLQDEDIKSLIDSVADSGGSYESLSQNKNKLHSVGRLLSNIAKASTTSCNVVFESVFIRLSNSLWLPPTAASQNAVLVGSNVACQKLNFSALYLCVEILDACRELAAASSRLAPSTSFLEDTWCQMLIGCSSILVKTFVSDLAIVDEMLHIADISLRVKGLQILATFPGGSLPVSTSIFDGILVTLVSVVTEKPTLTSLRKMSLKALAEIGTFLHEYPCPEKLESYLSTVIERIILLISVDVSTMPYSLALEALSEICASGHSFMSRIVEAVQEAISAIFIEVFVDGDMEQAKKLVQLLDCYSSNLLPRYHKVEGLGGVPLRFASDIWDHIAMTLDFCVTGEELLNATKQALKQAVTMCSEDDQCTLLQKASRVISSSNSFSPKSVTSQLEGLEITQNLDCLSGKDKWLVSLFGSVIIALHPQTQLPNTRAVIEFLLINFLKGDVTSAQALGSIVNKMDLKDSQTQNQSYMCLDDVLELIIRMTLGSCRDFFLQNGIKMVNPSESCLNVVDCFVFQTKCISGLAWIGKGLLLRGHERLKDITMIFFKFLVSSNELEALFDQSNWVERDKGMILSLMNSAADAFHVLLSDSEDCLNKTFHASVRPLYKQRLSSLYRALGHILCDTPLAAVLAESKKLLPVLVDVIAVLSEDPINKDLIYSLLLVLSGLLLDKNGQETALDNVRVIINCLTKLLSYPHKMLVRETAVQCLVAMSAMPHTRIYPMRTQVLGALSKVLDDPKRSVRVEAVRCRQAWASKV
ncbi:hypothetical protein KSS87_005742 [Heliosperma pusillum]|nr:hypothetical protein KSS87_005742 [Heliosperma pusillum]